MGKKHAPSLMRQIRRELKQGKSPDNLFPKVKSISDSYYRSLSFYLLIPYLSPNSKQFQEAISLAGKDIDKVQQSWRRIELLGSISKSLKAIRDTDIMYESYSTILEKLDNEKNKDIKEFLLKYSKNFPEFCLGTLLSISSKLRGLVIYLGITNEVGRNPTTTVAFVFGRVLFNAGSLFITFDSFFGTSGDTCEVALIFLIPDLERRRQM